jgi:hypothetical protein
MDETGALTIVNEAGKVTSCSQVRIHRHAGSVDKRFHNTTIVNQPDKSKAKWRQEGV